MKSLSLKLKMGNEKITSFGGSIIIADFIKSVGLEKKLDALLPKAGSNRGYKPSKKILSFISSIMLSGEGRYVNIDRLRNDMVFKTILKIKKIKGSDLFIPYSRLRLPWSGFLFSLIILNIGGRHYE